MANDNSAPRIHTISLKECLNGIRWRGLPVPYKRSTWEKAYQQPYDTYQE